MGEGAGVTTAGELLRSLSGLQSAAAAEHLLAIEVGSGGTRDPAFGLQFAVVASECRDWVAITQDNTWLFVEETISEFVRSTQNVQMSLATVGIESVSVQSESGQSMFASAAQQQAFIFEKDQQPVIKTNP